MVCTNNIDFSKKVLFTHIPKTAGISIHKAMFGYHDNKGYHIPISKYQQKIYDGFFKFSVIRNPYSRCFSLYNQLMKSNHPSTFNYNKVNLHESKFLNQKSFKEWINDFYIFREKDDYFKLITETQTYYLFYNNQNQMDYMIRFENLNEDWFSVYSKFGYDSVLEKIPNNKNVKQNHYLDYYDETIKKMVQEIYKDDFINFNYDF